jgi:hypothetical protein
METLKPGDYNPPGVFLEFGMPRRKTLIRTLLVIVALVVAVLGVLYYRANRMPNNYRPLTLTAGEKEQASKTFVQEVVVDFRNKTQQIAPFAWSISQRDINRYLASIDEIVSVLAAWERGRVDAAMKQMGLADPAAVLEEGTITLMIRSRRFGNVLSAKLAADLTDSKRLRIRLVGARVGKLPVPKGLVLKPLGRLCQELWVYRWASGESNGDRPKDVCGVLAALIGAIDGEPINPEEIWRIKGIGIRIEELAIAQGRLALKIQPVGPVRD